MRATVAVTAHLKEAEEFIRFRMKEKFNLNPRFNQLHLESNYIKTNLKGIYPY
ncbi:MAG: hypothetical protein NTX44_06455 [Ignavibacteriales bacterium]|nr:hypothetical protein [Ignavibacteriales bacterium]